MNEFVTYLRMHRINRDDTVYEVQGSDVRVRDFEGIHATEPVIWTRTVAGYGHVQNGRIRTWTKRELMAADIVAIPKGEAL